MKSLAILTDVTRCIGCEECVAACKETNHTGDDAPYRWQQDPSDVSSTRWTTIAETEGRYVRVHCRHCLDPACAAACPVGALRHTESGAVAYDPTICMGCRYCMMACPFRLTRYEWDSPVPRVRKCILCYDKLRSGELKQPACTAACPKEATIFGEREALLAEAKRRIREAPGRYLDHVYGEHELGGTSVLYISDVELTSAGWPAQLGTEPVPRLARGVLHTVPPTFVGVAAAMYGFHWFTRRKQQVAEAAGQAASAAGAAPPPGTGKQDTEEDR
jgi:formate dehydrogenase iron-sulfur subunit